MKKGTTATIKVDLQLEGVQKIIFTFNNSDATTTEPTLQKVFPGNDVRHEDDGYYIGLNQTDTEKLEETFYLEAQVNFIGGAVTKSLIKKVKMPHTLFTEKLTQSASNGEEVDVELETESVVETVSADYEDLENKPQINNITLIGNKTAHDLGLATPGEVESAEQSAKDYADNIALNLGNNLAVSINTQTYVLTFTLKHDNGTLSTASVDLPLESTVVSGRYDKTSKKLILTLVSGEVIEIPLGDLIDGLVSTDDLALALADYQLKITSSNKLDADLVDDEESENKFTNETEKAKWNAEATVFDAIYDNGQIVKTTSSYPNIKKNDLIIDTDVANNPQTSVKIWRVKFTPSTTLELELLSGIVVINDTPPTEQYGSSGIYTVDQMVFSKNGNFYRCATATRGQGNLYTYTWQTYDITGKQDKIDSNHKLDADLLDDSESTNKLTNETEKARWNNKQDAISVSGHVTKSGSTIGTEANKTYTLMYKDDGTVDYRASMYPRITYGDLIIDHPRGAYNSLRIYKYEGMSGDNITMGEIKQISFINGAPPTRLDSHDSPSVYYRQDEVLFSTNGNIYYCEQDNYDDDQMVHNYTWRTYRSIPASTSADSGKFLVVDSNGNPIWKTIPRAEDNSF